MRERILGGRLGQKSFDHSTELGQLSDPPPNRGLQLTPNSEVHSIRGIVLAADASSPVLTVITVWCR